MFDAVKQDTRRYLITDDEAKGVIAVINLFVFNHSFWVILSYRFGRWVRNNCRVPLLREILKIMSRCWHSWLGLTTGIQIPFETEIGGGLYIGHTGTLIMNTDVIIGSNCNVGVGVVIGEGGREGRRGSPVIGNNVFIGVGAKIIGPIKIGDNVAIGANAVVIDDIPDNASAAGIPAKVINYSGSGDFVKRPGQ
jgi:serine O-acetyltransferase